MNTLPWRPIGPGRWQTAVVPHQENGYWVLTTVEHRGPTPPGAPGPPVRPYIPPAWRPPLPNPRQVALADKFAQIRAVREGSRIAEQARERERAERQAREARERAERERRRMEEQRRLGERLEGERQASEQRLHDQAARVSALQAQALRNQRARQQADALLEFNRSVGRKWMAERGLFGLSGGLRPVAKGLAMAGSKASEMLGAVAPAPIMQAGAVAMGGIYERGLHEINQYEDFLRRQGLEGGPQRVKITPDAAQPDPTMVPVGNYEVVLAGTVKLSQQDRLVRDIAKAFADRLMEQQAGRPGASVQQISTDAHRLVQEVDLPEICRRYGIPAHQVGVEPITGVTGAGGGQVKYDIGVHQRRAAMIELKSSDYSSDRTALQLQAHQIGVGEQTATYGKTGDYYRIYARERLIEKWTGEDLARSLRSQRTAPLNRARWKVAPGKFRVR